MAVAQVTRPDSKLAIARGLHGQTAASSLGEVLGLGSCDEDDLYAAMDWLQARQQKIEDAPAARHLAGGTLVLYDVSSAAFEGQTCPQGAVGHPKDGVRGRLQIVYGLLTSPEGIPVAIEVFAGNTGDPMTVASQVTKVKDRFGITRVVLVGDRGMLTAASRRADRPWRCYRPDHPAGNTTGQRVPLSSPPRPRVPPPRVQLRLGRSRTLVPRRCSLSLRRCGRYPRRAPPRREYLRRHRR